MQRPGSSPAAHISRAEFEPIHTWAICSSTDMGGFRIGRVPLMAGGLAAIFLSLALAGTAGATSVDLLNSANVRIDGAAGADRSGFAVSDAGDVNGDGRADVIIGAYQAQNHTRPDSGSSYVIYGQANPSNIDLLALTPSQGFQIDGAAAFDESGFAVSGAGDTNADGFADVVIGSESASNNSRTSSGSAYVIYGHASNSNIDLLTLPAARGFRIDGATPFEHTGTSVSSAGDVNGDGRADVIVGADFADNNSRTDSGSAYVIYGEATPANIDTVALTSSQGFRIDGAAGGDAD